MTKISDYLKDTEGNPSSQRLFSWWLLWFFFAFNGLYLALGGVIEVNFIMFDFMILIGIFAPKYLQKMQEVKQIIEKTRQSNDS